MYRLTDAEQEQVEAAQDAIRAAMPELPQESWAHEPRLHLYETNDGHIDVAAYVRDVSVFLGVARHRLRTQVSNEASPLGGGPVSNT